MKAEAKKILIVDDEAPMRALLQDFFSSQGYSVSCASSGEAALRSISADGSFAVVVSDIRMFPLDGLEMLAKMQLLCPTIPVLLFTAAGTPNEHRRAIEMGASHYLHKPFSLTELKRLLEEEVLKHPPTA